MRCHSGFFLKVPIQSGRAFVNLFRGGRGVVLAAFMGILVALPGCARRPRTGVSETPPPSRNDSSAIGSFLNPMTLDTARRNDAAFAKEEAAASESILNPARSASQALRSAAPVSPAPDRSVYILNPKEVETELMKDPEQRRKRDEAFGAGSQGRP